MPLNNNLTRTHLQGIHFFISYRAQRVSKLSSMPSFHAQPPSKSNLFDNPETLWFIKVLCTLCVRTSPSFHVFDSHYFKDNLNPFLAFQVIRYVNFNFNNPRLAFSFFQFSRMNLSIIHDFVTYDMLLRSFCQKGVFDLAKLVLDRMWLDGYLLDSRLFDFLVMSFANAGKLEIAKELFVAQEELVCRFGYDNVGTTSSFVYNNFLNLLVKLNRVNEAVGFFRDRILRSKCYFPDTCTFNIVLRGVCRVGEIDKAFILFNDMGSFGCKPDVVSYNSLINGLSRIGDVDRACELLRKIKLQNDISPDVVTYTSVISGYCKLGEMEKALSIFDEMLSGGMKPNLVTFNALIDGFGKIGDMNSASNMYKKMLNLGCRPDVVTFTSLVDGHCRMGQVDHGLNFCNEMEARNLPLNVYTFSVIINALCKQNRLDEARGFLSQLKYRKDIVPQPFLYNPVIDGFCKAGNIDEANVIVTEMEEKKCKPDKLTFTILILGHCMKGKMLEAINIFNKMLNVNCAPDNVTIKSLISCLRKAGMPNEAHKIRLAALEYLGSRMPSSRRTVPSTAIPVAVSK